MENQDLDLIGKTVGNMPYKIGIVDQSGNLKNQFVAKASTNRIDIPQSILGTGGSSSTGGTTGGNTGSGGNTGGGDSGSTKPSIPQLPLNMILATGEFMDDVTLSGVDQSFSNVSGLEIDVDPYIYEDNGDTRSMRRVLLSDINLPTKYFLAKKDLVNSNNVSFIPSTYDISKVATRIRFYQLLSSGWATSVTPTPPLDLVSVENNFIKIGLGKLTFSDAFNFKYDSAFTQDTSISKYRFKILTIKNWKGE